MYLNAQDMRDRHQVLDHQVLKMPEDKNMTFVLYSFGNIENASNFKNDPELIERMKSGGVNGSCACGDNCDCGYSKCPCEDVEEKVHCECNCGGGGTKLVIFTKVHSCPNITVKENASFLMFQEVNDYNHWMKVYTSSTDIFETHNVISRTVYTLPDNTNFVLVVFTYANINSCLEMATDPIFAEKLEKTAVRNSTFAKKFALEHVN